MPEAFRYGCACCGSEEIEEANVVTVMYEITAWDEHGRPTRYGNMRETEAIGREDPPYWCRRCMKEAVTV